MALAIAVYYTILKVVSVVIPAYNEEDYIGKLLVSLKKQTFKDFEIIVADGDSKDNTRKIAKSYAAKVVRGGSQSQGRNNGVRVARGEILLFLDADVTFGPEFVKKCINEFESNKADIACCYFDTRGLNFEMRMVYETWNRSKHMRRETKLPDGEGQCLWIKKSVFMHLKGFNEKLRISEDVDLIYRAVAKDYHYTMLEAKFKPSPRRYENVNIARVVLGSFIGSVEQLIGKPTTGRFAELVYGGWGIHNGKR